MHRTIKELKISARGSLLGHYKIVITTLIFSVIIVSLINMPFNQMTRQGIAYQVPPRIVLGAAGSLLVSLLSSLLNIGIAQIHLKIARRQETGFPDIFYAFQNRPDRFLGYNALILTVSVVCVLPGIILAMISVLLPPAGGSMILILFLAGAALCIAGCIIMFILLLGWALTPYLLLDQPDLRVMEALKQSRRLMHGGKARLLGLILSFLGWILFSVLSFGLGLLWITPYMTQTCTWFYLDRLPGTSAE